MAHRSKKRKRAAPADDGKRHENCPSTPSVIAGFLEEAFREEAHNVLLYRNALAPKVKPPIDVAALLKAKFLLQACRKAWPAMNFADVRLRKALQIVAKNLREHWGVFKTDEDELLWATEMSKRLRAALKDIRHTASVSPQKPWLKELWSAQKPTAITPATTGSSAEKTESYEVTWHGGTLDGYFTGYDEQTEAGWRVPFKTPKAAREPSTDIKRVGDTMWCTWDDGFMADITAELTPEAWETRQRASEKSRASNAPAALWTCTAEDGSTVRIVYSPQNKRQRLLILRVNGKQKCQILATQLGNVEKTLAIFSIVAKEYAAKTLSENDFYRRRDELVEEHGQVVDPEGAEEGGQEGHGAEASQRPTRKAMKAMKSKKAMKLENATMAQDASERRTRKAMKAMKSKPLLGEQSRKIGERALDRLHGKKASKKNGETGRTKKKQTASKRGANGKADAKKPSPRRSKEGPNGKADAKRVSKFRIIGKAMNSCEAHINRRLEHLPF